MRLQLRKPSRHTLKRAASVTVVLAALYALTGFVLLPLIIKPILIANLEKTLSRPVSVEKISFNPFALSVRVCNLIVQDRLPGHPLFRFDELFADLEAVSLFKRGLILREITLTGPRASIVRAKDNDFNFTDLLENKKEKTVQVAKSSPLRFYLGNIAIQKGRIDFADLPLSKDQVLDDIELAIPFLSNMEHCQEVFVTTVFSAVLNGSPVNLFGQAQPFRLTADNGFHLALNRLNLMHYAPYVPGSLGVKVLSGLVDAELHLSFRHDPDSGNQLAANGKLLLNGLDMTETDGKPLFRLSSLAMTLAHSEILKREFRLAKVIVQRPEFNLRRNADGTTNLDSLRSTPGSSVKMEDKKTTASDFLLAVDDFSVADGKIAIADQVSSDSFRTEIDPLDVSIVKFSTKAEDKAEYTLTATTEAGETIALTGTGRLSPLSAEGRLAIKEVNLPKYRPYYDGLLNFKLTSAALNLETSYQMDGSGPEPRLSLSGLALALHNLSCRREGEEPFLSIPSFALEKGKVDVAGRKLQLPRIRSKGGHVVGNQSADGTIDLSTLLRQPATSPAKKEAGPPWSIDIDEFEMTDYAVDFADHTPAKPLALRIGKLAVQGRKLSSREEGVTLDQLVLDLGDLSYRQEKEEPFLAIPSLRIEGLAVDQPGRKITMPLIKSSGGRLACKRASDGTLDLQAMFATRKSAERGKESGASWDVSLGRFQLTDYSVAFEDRAPARPVSMRLGKIDLKAQDISNRSSSKVPVECSLVIAKQGTLAIKGIIAPEPFSADLALTTKGISVAQFQPYWADHLKMTVSKGEISSHGQLTIRSKKKGPPGFRYAGEASLVDFTALDAAKAKMLDWKSLTVDGLDTSTAPFQLRMQEVGLTDYYLSLVLSPQGTLNLRDLRVEDEKKGDRSASRAAAKKPEPKTIEIDRVTLQGGVIDFTDHNITPNFTTKLIEVTGRVSGLSNNPATRAEVDLFAKLASRAPINITGTINPLAEELFVDLKASVKDVDLTSLSPYSGKYVGYTIRQGKLFLDTSYSILGTKIDSRHSFRLDQFNLGDQVTSKEATKAPVKLAIALLKNRKGEIHLELPVKGDLSRPDFKLGDAISKMIISLITKAATAPFALLGALFGGEELRYVEFDPGSVAILPVGRKKLDALAQALYDRPGLTLEIKGYAALDKDHEALVRQRFAELLVEGEGKGEKALAQVAAMSPEEVEKRLKKAYREADFPKPRNALGFVKWLEPEEMKKLLLSHVEVTDDDLLALADERAHVVTEYLRAAREFDSKRFSTLAPGVEPVRGEGRLSGSRVDFGLR